MGAVVTVGVQTINAPCGNVAPITFGALFGLPTTTRTVTSTTDPPIEPEGFGKFGT